MKPKLLVVTSTFPRWANDTDPPFVYELSRRLTDQFEITVHTPHYHGAQVNEHMAGMRVHRFRYFLSPFERLAGGQGIVPKLRRNKLYLLLLPFFLASQLCSLLLLVRREQPDVLHAHWLIPQGVLAVVVKKLFNVPVVVTAHGADVFGLRNPLCLRLKKWVVANADEVVTVSTALARVLADDTHSTVQPSIIPMGVDASQFSPDKKDTAIRDRYNIQGPFLLFVGRLTEKKGVRYLIDAMVTVTTAVPEAKLLIVGHGELEQELREQVKIRGLEKVVLFTGGIANAHLPAYYATADIFIGPSVQVKGGDTEGFGLTFVEAAMSGCLVIGTRVGGVEDIIKDGETGYLINPENIQCLADTIAVVLKKLGSLSSLREQGRQNALQRFDWENIANNYKEVLSALQTNPKLRATSVISTNRRDIRAK